MVIIIIESGGFLVLQAESASESANITTAGDAIWWAYVTITTVGYGDRFPVTTGGRLVGIMVMTTGVAVFATFAGLISSKLLASPAKDDEEKKPEEDIIPFEKQVITGIDEIKLYMSQQENKNQEISVRLDKLENLLKTDK
jgi:voltage-gated potassium channel